MKMTIEEKAKAYDSVFKRLKEMYNNNKTNVAAKLVYERYFPELKKSEGEEAIKNIIESLSILISYIEDDASVPDAKAFLIERIEKQIAWLEKQGEQKPAEWSEEDIETFERIISNYEYFCNTLTLEENWSETEKEACKKVDYEDIKWLKSLKDRCLPQSQWKPSEEQLTSLAWVIEYGNTSQTETLKKLLEQLKAL